MTDTTERAAQLEQLAHLKAMGEKAYDDMYDAYPPGNAGAFYSDAKECFYDAIGLAGDWALTKRPKHSKSGWRISKQCFAASSRNRHSSCHTSP